MRRCLALAALAVLTPWIGNAQSPTPKFEVTLLGTGTPTLRADRFGPSTLVAAGSHVLLFDAGRAATIRMAQVGVRPSTVGPIFLTHLHSDHLNGLMDVWLTGWIPGGGGRRTPLTVIGPRGTEDMMRHLSLAYAPDINMRIADQGLPREGATTVGVDMEAGQVFSADGVTVTAFEVDHGEALKPAYGFRIDYLGHSVVISGDTRFSQNLIDHSQRVDVLVHEVAAAREEYLNEVPAQRTIFAHHLTPEEAGRVFAETKPKLAVYSHITLGGDGKWPAPTEQDLVTRTRTVYKGPLQVGADLLTIDVLSGSVSRPTTVK